MAPGTSSSSGTRTLEKPPSNIFDDIDPSITRHLPACLGIWLLLSSVLILWAMGAFSSGHQVSTGNHEAQPQHVERSVGAFAVGEAAPKPSGLDLAAGAGASEPAASGAADAGHQAAKEQEQVAIAQGMSTPSGEQGGEDAEEGESEEGSAATGGDATPPPSDAGAAGGDATPEDAGGPPEAADREPGAVASEPTADPSEHAHSFQRPGAHDGDDDTADGNDGSDAEEDAGDAAPRGAPTVEPLAASGSVAEQVALPQVACNDTALLEGCACEGRPIGPGSEGDFGQDDRLASAFKPAPAGAASFWNFTAFQNGREISLFRFRTKAALIVNVASAGAGAAFYEEAPELLRRHAPAGFRLITVPSNQFGSQAPHSSQCERAFLYRKLGARPGAFPVLDKVHVNGDQAAPFYKFLKAQRPVAQPPVGSAADAAADGGAELAANFEKFLVNSKGQAVARFRADVAAKEYEDKIAGLLYNA